MGDKLNAALHGATKAERLALVYAEYRIDTTPALAKLRADAEGALVPHSGEVDNPLVALVGEAPGKNEHRTGQPFVGAAGKVLDKLLKSINLPRSSCFITNAVQYRPVDSAGRNRTPEEHEIEACKQYLIAELEIVQPKLVVTMGKVPLRSLVTVDAKIGACHGMRARREITAVPWVPLVTLYHPAVAVYQKSMEPTLRQDMAAVAAVLRQQGVSL